MSRKILGLTLLLLAFGVVGVAVASQGGTSVNNGGGTPSCGNSCDQSHNPTDYEKPCRPVPGNGCHTLPDTPCERGHGGTEIGNKHCRPALTMVKEQKLEEQPATAFTTSVITAGLNQGDIDYRITVRNFTNVAYSLVASDPNCDAFEGSGLSPSTTANLTPMGTAVFTCSIDVIVGIGDPVATLPGPFTNTATVVATPLSGSPITLTRSVTANVVS